MNGKTMVGLIAAAAAKGKGVDETRIWEDCALPSEVPPQTVLVVMEKN